MTEHKEVKELKKFITSRLEPLIQLVRERGADEMRLESSGFSLAIRFSTGTEPLLKEEKIPEEEAPGDEQVSVTANMVGIFHQAATPFEPPLIEAGKDVARGEVIGYIESMRLMHELRSPCAGRVRKILVEENDAVDFGKAIIDVETYA
jgi:biotin carboxyl carrier protein